MSNDECDIIAVLTRYAAGIDQRDWKLFHSCFASGFEGDYAGFGQWKGADAITAFMETAHASRGPTLHRLSNFVVTMDKGKATARCYVDALLMPGVEGEAVHQAVGWYDDKLALTASGWKIAYRKFVAVRIMSLDR